MTDRERISAPDLERLSAYLDGELGPSESSRLEARLRDEPTLRQVLHELSGTVDLVRSLPAAPSPRDFRLTEQLAAARAGLLERLLGLGLYPVMQLGTAVAALAFVLLAGFDVLVNNSLAGVSLGRDAAPAASPVAGQRAAETIEMEQLQEEIERPMMLAEEQVQGTPEAFGAADEAQPGAEEGEEQPEQEAAAEQVGASGPEAADELGARSAAGGGPLAESDAAAPPAFDRGESALATEARTALTGAEIGLAAATVLLLITTLRIRRRAS